MELITSVNNQRVKEVANLKQKNTGRKAEPFLRKDCAPWRKRYSMRM